MGERRPLLVTEYSFSEEGNFHSDTTPNDEEVSNSESYTQTITNMNLAPHLAYNCWYFTTKAPFGRA